MSHGVSADAIIFANPTKLISHLCYAAKMDIRKMTADGEYELLKIHELFPSAEYVYAQRTPSAIWPRVQARDHMNCGDSCNSQSGAAHQMQRKRLNTQAWK